MARDQFNPVSPYNLFQTSCTNRLMKIKSYFTQAKAFASSFTSLCWKVTLFFACSEELPLYAHLYLVKRQLNDKFSIHSSFLERSIKRPSVYYYLPYVLFLIASL